MMDTETRNGKTPGKTPARTKLGRKPSRKTPMRVPKHGGGRLRVGNPGNAGGGRPPNEFKAKMAELASSKEALHYLEQCVKGKHGPKAALSAQQYVAERGYGKVPSVTKLEGGSESLQVVLVHRKDRAAGAGGGHRGSLINGGLINHSLINDGLIR